MVEKVRYLIQIIGLVQGVGMRPFIYKIAKLNNLTGFVKNQGASVVIDVCGNENDVNNFINIITKSPPENAIIQEIQIHQLKIANNNDFIILNSLKNINHQGLILPDIAVCEDCINDIRSNNDRRYHYAFTNCTNCGPRYSILNDLPYDRVSTSMSLFEMCNQCNNEYKNPNDRRFHAQPNCCSKCGPQYQLFDCNNIKVECDNPITKVKELLKKRRIVAIKGIGGYHLVCSAIDDKAITSLRKRKNRPDKPLAIMAKDIEDIESICTMNIKEQETISNNKKPIVLLSKSNNDILPESVAPRLKRYGVMLPYAPLHYLIFDDDLKYLVMTSGNISGMPICYKDDDAINKLSSVADYFLIHNREIMTPVDDSVVRVFNNEVLISRCGRGYSPTSIKIKSNNEILALGGEQKASICLVHKGFAHISQYMGSLNRTEICSEYIKVINRLKNLLKAEPQFIAHDLHPDYFSTKHANKIIKTKIPIQHHHAHMAGCMKENELTQNVIGVIYDGTGMGIDGAIWGGEFFVGTMSNFKRVGHLKYVNIQGGDSAIKEPWKCAVSYLHSIQSKAEDVLSYIDKEKIDIIEKAIQNNINCFKSSSMGRFFDCIATLVFQITKVTYDAQAAIVLENIIDNTVTDMYDYSMNNIDERLILDFNNILQGVISDLHNCKPASYISAKFHNTISDATISCVKKIKEKYNINDVVLSGGVFENHYLLSKIYNELRSQGFNVYYNKLVPTNDGGLSFGQAAATVSMLEEDGYVSGCSSKDFINI